MAAASLYFSASRNATGPRTSHDAGRSAPHGGALCDGTRWCRLSDRTSFSAGSGAQSRAADSVCGRCACVADARWRRIRVPLAERRFAAGAASIVAAGAGPSGPAGWSASRSGGDNGPAREHSLRSAERGPHSWSCEQPTGPHAGSRRAHNRASASRDSPPVNTAKPGGWQVSLDKCRPVFVRQRVLQGPRGASKVR